MILTSMKLSQVKWFYEEPLKTSKRLFDSFAQGQDQITARSLRQHMNGLKLFPTPEEI